jgi:hypothetical protein
MDNTARWKTSKGMSTLLQEVLTLLYYAHDSLILFAGGIDYWNFEQFYRRALPSSPFAYCITSAREGDSILFTHEGGVDIGDVDAKALTLNLPVRLPLAKVERCQRIGGPPW